MPVVCCGAADSKRSIDHCIANLKAEKRSPRIVSVYCRCMAESIEEDEMLSFARQTEMERSFPPVHKLCYKKAGWRQAAQ